MFKSLPGFREFYPEDCAIRNHIFTIWKKTAKTFQFLEYDGPILESLELFTAKSGDEIASQLFAFEDQGGRKVALRPELTPTLARLVSAKANTLPKPIKWFNIGENFRYERPQKGRLRSFYQLNCDILGENSPKADAEIIALMVQSLKAFGFESGDFVIRLSDRNIWVYLLESYGLSEGQIEGTLGIIDKFERLAQEKIEEELSKILGLEKATDFFFKAKELMGLNTIGALQDFLKASNNEKLQSRGEDWLVLVDYLNAFHLQDFIKIDLTIVRGLAYYTGFVFEAFQTIGKGRALGGGGRYDHLIEKLGGQDLPAVGFAIGDVTLRDFLELKGLVPNYIQSPDFYAIFEEALRLEVLSTISILRDHGFSVEYSLKEQSVNKQHKTASQLSPQFILIFQEGGKVTAKNSQTKEETVIDAEDILTFIQQQTP